MSHDSNPSPTTPEHDADSVSDPAHDNTEGQDWSTEGGATPKGPATDTEAEDGRQSAAAPSEGD